MIMWVSPWLTVFLDPPGAAAPAVLAFRQQVTPLDPVWESRVGGRVRDAAVVWHRRPLSVDAEVGGDRAGCAFVTFQGVDETPWSRVRHLAI